MFLQKKVILIIMMGFLVFGTIVTIAQLFIILPSFFKLEQEEALKDMERADLAISREIQLLDTSVSDWSFWDDTYQFAQDQNLAYRDANLIDLTFDGLKVNLLYIYNADQQLVWGMGYDLDNQTELTLPGVAEQLGNIRLTEQESSAGVVITSHGPLLIAARPILTSDRQGPVEGIFILGRFLDTAEIGNQARIALNATVINSPNVDIETTAILAEMGAIGETLIRKDGAVNRVYKVFADMENNPALLLRVDVPRTISSRGKSSVEFALFSLLGVGLLILVVLINLIRRMVLLPLKQLTDHTVALGQNDSSIKPLSLKRSDEIGVLGQEFDRMVERLEKAHKDLTEQSYHSGMAEVATGVLHNVGNTLNSINVSCTLLIDQLSESRVGNVTKVADMVVEPEGGLARFLTKDPRGQQIPAYLASLGIALQEEQQLMSKEAALLKGQIEHIKEIIRMQQTYSRTTSVIETTTPEQMMEDAIKINADDLAHHKVTVRREFQPVQPISVDRHKVLQILLNLISNAKYACVESNNKDKMVTLRIACSGQNCLSMQVADNGTGISPENLVHIFQYGFTTRKDGHGFGLHSSALTAHNLGGSLSVCSDGPGQGATFTLELPYLKEKKNETR